ncbi:hypothetical protein SUGI_0317620 [Cryptomeria japonica]|uniref:U-box domain-containing protein 13 n=1 Tax=Cryptomeria japonica TaxID=3369 RepID=UPI002408CC27|nr:U-box domain-containing protein 13 [Cryptomeria japonica]GLJ18017.1 hypothetical protein SUGI_0317620 [Cryptomeria japonica]
MCADPLLAGIMQRIWKSIEDTKRVVNDIVVGKSNFLMLAFYLIQLGELLKGLSEEEEFVIADSSQALLQGTADVLEGIFAFTNHCRNRSRIFLLYKCDEVVKEITEHVQKVVECLALILQENDKISLSMKDEIITMQSKLSSALFFAEPEHQKIAKEISDSLAGNQSEEIDATGLLRRIAQVLNVQPFEASELKQELERDLEATRTDGRLYALLESAAVLDAVRKLAAEDSSAGPADDIAIPSSFYCPITGQIMEDPVMLVEAGYTYERYAITEWFERGHKTCPDTGKALESLELVPNLQLKQNMEEVFNMKRQKTMLHAINQIRAQESPQEIEEAVDTLKQLMDVHPKYKRLIVTLDGIRPLVDYLKPAEQNLKERLFRILYLIAALGDEYKSSIIEAGAVPISLRLLQRSPAECGGPVQLLWELSKIERGRVAILAYKASVVVVASAYNLCTHDQKVQAEQLLHTLCEYDKAATVQAASSGIFWPLVTKLTSGNETVQLEMSEVICTIDLNEAGSSSLVDAGAVPPLLLLLQNGSEACKLEAAKALRRLSNSESNKVAIARCGTIPVLVKALSYPIPNLGVEIMATLANLATDRQSAAEIDQEGAVARLFEMLEAKDIGIHEYALKTLQWMAKDSQTVRQSVAELNIIPKIYYLLQNEEFSSSCRTSMLNLLCFLAEDRATRQAVTSHNRIKYFIDLLKDPVSSDETEAILGILAALAKVDGAKELMVLDGHLMEVSMQCLRSANPKMKEHVTVLLSKLTNQTFTDKSILLNLARSGIISLLIDVVQTGSERAKQHAAVTLGHLSQQTPSLTERLSFFKNLLARFGFLKYKTCNVHAGKCNPKRSLCLVESQAAIHLINLLRDGGQRSAVSAIDALFTLIKSNEDREKGADYLVKNDILNLAVQVVGKNDKSTEKAAMLLERIYRCRKFRDARYADIGKSALYTTMTTGNAQARKHAANALMHLRMMAKNSTYTQTSTT